MKFFIILFINLTLLYSASAEPLIVAMDSGLREKVFDLETWKAGKSNADVVKSILEKHGYESIAITVRHYDKPNVLSIDPDLVVIHASAFHNPLDNNYAYYKLLSFLNHMLPSDANILIYSRGYLPSKSNFLGDIFRSNPYLRGRVRAIVISTFKGSNKLLLKNVERMID